MQQPRRTGCPPGEGRQPGRRIWRTLRCWSESAARGVRLQHLRSSSCTLDFSSAFEEITIHSAAQRESRREFDGGAKTLLCLGRLAGIKNCQMLSKANPRLRVFRFRARRDAKMYGSRFDVTFVTEQPCEGGVGRQGSRNFRQHALKQPTRFGVVTLLVRTLGAKDTPLVRSKTAFSSTPMLWVV